MVVKKVIFCGNAEKELLALPKAILEKFALDLEFIANGMEPLSRVSPLNGLGKGVLELKKNGKPAYRCVYVVDDDAIHVLHAFLKTSDGLDKKHETTIKSRYANRG